MNGDRNIDVAAIREAAEKATRGPWFVDQSGNGEGQVFVGNRQDGRRWGLWEIVHMSGDRMGDLTDRSRRQHLADARHIATMDPPTTLALLDALDAARAEVERLRIGLDGAHGNADRMRKSLLDERDAIAEKIAVAIEAEMRRHDGAQIGFSGKGDTYAHAARIAREVGKA